MADSTIPRNESAPGTCPSVEKIAPGVTCEWLHDRAIVVYTVGGITRISVDGWLEHMKQQMIAWPPDRQWLVLQDFSSDNIGPTTYIRERTQGIMNWRPELKAHVAVILARNFRGRMIQVFLQGQRDSVPRIFVSRTEGLAWLQSYLPSAQRLPG